MSERYVLLGLARARSPWFRELARSATAAALPVEFVKCVSAEELRARLASGRVFSAALVDGGLPALDRDLADEAASHGVPVVVVDDDRSRRDWAAMGVAAVLPAAFDRRTLLDVLGSCARPVERADDVPGPPEPTATPQWRGSVVTVCGSGGTGASTVAVALAQGLAHDVRAGGPVLLADLALHAEQAMLHDARDVVPSVQELVEAHRLGRPSVEEVRALTFAVPERGYRLLLGLRQARLWPALRPRAVEAAFDSVRAGWRVVVCDADADVEGEDDCGSADVEDRHVLARTAVRSSDVVLVVGVPGMKGVHSLARVLHELEAFGVRPGRLVPVVNRAPRNRRARAEIVRALDRSAVVFLPERRVDEAFRDGVRLPASLTAPLVGAYLAVRERQGPVDAPTAGPLQPGSLAVWSS
ncbi:MAG TPA: hypothetical protein VHF47_00340 [Acidimicrobiales bacterium]|nr:hypothetical protein [Acidimicrobiales bacterium]